MCSAAVTKSVVALPTAGLVLRGSRSLFAVPRRAGCHGAVGVRGLRSSRQNARSAGPPVPLQARKMWRGDHGEASVFEWVV